MLLGRRLAAEALGTFALVFFGAGSIMVEAKYGACRPARDRPCLWSCDHDDDLRARTHLRRPLQPGRLFRLRPHAPLPLDRAAAYWLAQCLGAIAAALLLRASLGDVAEIGATEPSGSDGQSFIWEVVLAFFLMLVIMAVATDARAVGETAAIAVGGTVALAALVGGAVSGASMNPARSLGPALAAGELGSLWIYLLGPLLGAALGALAYQLLRGEQSRPAGAGDFL